MTDTTCITDWVFKYAKKSNTRVFTLVDSCRVYEQFKGGKTHAEPALGVYYIGYAVKPDKSANAG